MQAFLNELSLPSLYSQNNVRELFSQLGKCYKEASKSGVREIKILSTFYNHEFAPNYTYVNWLSDSTADDDLKTLLKSVLGSVPFVDDILTQYQVENNTALTFTYDGNPCIGLGLANEKIFNTLTFSYDENTWGLSNYDVIITTLNEDEEGNLKESKELYNTRNVTNEKHFNEHVDFINNQVSKSIQGGKELWKLKSDLFPNLIFCDEVKSQIADMYYNTLGFKQIIMCLFDLQNAAANCDGNPIKPEDFPSLTTKESSSRLKKFKERLTILGPDGNYFFCSWHSRYTPGAGRIHFYPIEKEKRFVIGSIANQNSIK